MKQVQISERLKGVAALVSPCETIADVGCDHGYIPIYLLQQGRIQKAIAMDVKKGPLERADAHIREYGMGEYIETRLSNGVEALMEGEAQAVVIAGMGGPLMEKILTEGETVLSRAEQLILQPQSEIGAFRRFLHDKGYGILSENMVLEDGKFYPMMKAARLQQKYEREMDYLFGRELLEKRHPVLKKFLEKELAAKKAVILRLNEADTQTARKRKEEMMQQEDLIKEALCIFFD